MHPEIDSLLSINRKQSIKKLLEMRKYLYDKRFQFVYDLHNSIRSNILTYWISKKIYRLKKPRFKRSGLFFFHINNFQKEFSSETKDVDLDEKIVTKNNTIKEDLDKNGWK